MALKRIVSNKHFSGNYTNDEILNLFSNDENIKYGEIIIFNDKANPTLYFLDDNGELVSIQRIYTDNNGDIDNIIGLIRELSDDIHDLTITVTNNKDEADFRLNILDARVELLEENGGNGVSEEILNQINKNTDNIENLSLKLIKVDKSVDELREEVNENELVHSAGLNALKSNIKTIE